MFIKKSGKNIVYLTRTLTKVHLIMHFFGKLILQEETKPKPSFLTFVYNECTGIMGVNQLYNFSK